MLDAERLRSPSWTCLHFVPAADITAELISDLEVSGLACFHLNGDGVQTPVDVLRGLASTMSFPGYFGLNWDAAEECLRDIGEWRPANGYILFIHDADWFWRQHYESMGALAMIWQSVAEEWAQDDLPFHLVFIASSRPAARA